MTAPTSPDHSGVRFPPPFVYAGLLLVGYGIHRLWPVALIPKASEWLDPIGGVLVGIGVGVALTAAITFRRAGTHVNPTKPATTVVAHGPFRFTRNPMYLSLALVYLGVTALINSLWPLLLFPPVIWIISTFVIAREEAYLERKFGATYLEYKKRVRRWL
jgi:protein-S-isoprenylcysteine O-methyltransferase Ste14